MKNKRCLITIIFVLLILTACQKAKEYVYFDFGCGNTEYYKCELKKNRLNCDVKYPTCEDKEFLGWYEADNYEDKLDLYGTFIKNTIIYARWKDDIEETSSMYEEPSMIVEEPSSTIEVSSYIDEPSSAKEEVSNTIIKEYTITLMLNNGTNTQSKKVKVKYGEALPTIGNVPTMTGYTFLGWYDSKTGGTQYYNEKNVPVVKKYTKTSNITLYGRWRENTLSIRYNANGGTWKTSSNKYSLNVDGTVIVKSTNEIYEQKVKYGEKLDSNGLVDYNGSWFNWKRSGYSVLVEKEYFLIKNASKKELNQSTQYKAEQLAEYAECDLSKSDCTITIKVNWKKDNPPLKPSSSENVIYSDETETLKVYITQQNNYFLTRIWVANAYTQFNKQNAKEYGKNREEPKDILQDAINENNLSNKSVLGFNASGFFEKGSWGTENVNYNPIVNRTSAGTVVITNGKVIRNAYQKGDIVTWFITGIDKNNQMVIFEDTKMDETNSTEKKAWADKVIASGIRNTYTFSAPIILNGKREDPDKPSYYYMKEAAPNYKLVGLQLFCQIDDNNFALFTSREQTRNVGIYTLLNLGCKTAVNLDGGGSIALLFKSSNSTEIRARGALRKLTEIGYVTE